MKVEKHVIQCEQTRSELIVMRAKLIAAKAPQQHVDQLFADAPAGLLEFAPEKS